MKNKFKSMIKPPGYDMDMEIFFGYFLLVVYLCWIALTVFARIPNCFYSQNGVNYCKSFEWLTNGSCFFFWFVLWHSIENIKKHYKYFKGDTKSIYTMKRIPSSAEIHINCLTVPLMELAAAVLISVIVLLIAKMVYSSKITADIQLADDAVFSVWGLLRCRMIYYMFVG